MEQDPRIKARWAGQVVHLTYRQPYVTFCGRAALADSDSVIDLAEIDVEPARTLAAVQAAGRQVCPRCEDARARGRFCELGHAWPFDAMHGEPCQCRALTLLRDDTTETIVVRPSPADDEAL